MMKALWKSVSDLKTPERKLLFGIMLAGIVVLWAAFQGIYTRALNAAQAEKIEQQRLIERLVQENKNTQLFYQSKLDQCNEDRIAQLKEIYQQTQKILK